MIISSTMNLSELRALLGSRALLEQARQLRLLLTKTSYASTDDVPEEEWERLCAEADGNAVLVLEEDARRHEERMELARERRHGIHEQEAGEPNDGFDEFHFGAVA